MFWLYCLNLQQKQMKCIMDQAMDEHIKKNFNEVDNITAICRRNSLSDIYSYPELEIGKTYNVTHIGVFRSFTRIMLSGFEDKEYNSVCFEIFENGESIDKKYTKEFRFFAPYLREIYNKRNKRSLTQAKK